MLQEINIEKYQPGKSRKSSYQKNNVRSIQRLGVNLDLNAHEVAYEYLRWLPSSTNFLIRVKKEEDIIKFCLFGILTLLKLQYIPNSKIKSRAKFHVIGGLLTKNTSTGWLEFRSVAEVKYLLASINEFIPSLPWYIYKYTQAILHSYVMQKFSKHLRRENCKN